MRITTLAIFAATALLLAGCTSDAPAAAGDPSTAATSTSPDAEPPVDSSSEGTVALRGDWEDPQAEWVVHLEEDGTFTEDFEGLTDFRVGTYEVEGDIVRLLGDDGNTDEGTVVGSGDTTQLEFNLGTLTRQ
ncbi:MAG: hypothetical protein WCB95_11030 [Aeromicrobium sp.]